MLQDKTFEKNALDFDRADGRSRIQYNNSNSFFYSLDSDKKCGVLFYRDSILKQNPLIKTHCGHIGYIYPKHFGGDDDDDDPKPDKSGDKDAD